MEPLAPIPFPPAADAAEDVALDEVDVAIALVAHGAAVRVRIAGLSAAIAEAVAGIAAAPAPAASGSGSSSSARRAARRSRSGRVPEAGDRRTRTFGATSGSAGAGAPPTGASSSRRRRRPTSATPRRASSGRSSPRATRPAPAGASPRGLGGSCSAGRWRPTRRRPSGCRRQGARRVLERQPLVGRLRDGGDPLHVARGRPGAFWLTLPISLVIVAILGIIVVSYRQTIAGLPERRRQLHRREGEPRPERRADRGRGAARRLRADGLGQRRGRDRGDHVGVPGAARGLPRRAGGRVRSSLVMLVNLRGIRESGTIFAIPTYVFLVLDAGADRRRPRARRCSARRRRSAA